MAHTCHAIGCDVPVPRKMLMCRQHWRLVPRAAQQAVWAAYELGQERTGETTEVYRMVAAGAVIAVAEHEHKHIPPIWYRMRDGKQEA